MTTKKWQNRFISLFIILWYVVLFYGHVRIFRPMPLNITATLTFLSLATLLLYINSNDIIEWIEQQRALNRSTQRPILIYDGHCVFCIKCLRVLKVMDLFEALEYRSFYEYLEKKESLPGGLWIDQVQKQMYIVAGNEKKYGGYAAFRRICWYMPMMIPLIPVIFFPGMGILGPWLYDLVAKNRKCLGKKGKGKLC